MYAFCKLIFLILPLALAVPWDGAYVTQKPAFEPFFHTVQKRQDSSLTAAQTLSSTLPACAYVSGSTSYSYTCGVSYTCAVATAQQAWGCCSALSGCGLATSCVPQSLLSSCATDSSCVNANNAYLRKCGTTAPYCNQIVLSGAADVPLTAWECESTPYTVTAFATATDGGKSVASYIEVQLSIQLPSSTFISSSSSYMQSTTTTIFTTTTSTFSSTSSSLGPTSPASAPSPVPVGPIVGGVLGGIAVLACLGVVLFFLLRRKPSLSQQSVADLSPSARQPETTTPYVSPYIQPFPPKENHQYQARPLSPLSANSSQFQQPAQSPPTTAELYSPPLNQSPQYTAYSAPQQGFQVVSQPGQVQQMASGSYYPHVSSSHQYATMYPVPHIQPQPTAPAAAAAELYSSQYTPHSPPPPSTTH